MNELKNRGLNDVLMAVVDERKSLPSRKRGTFPRRLPRCFR